jgi:similar to stage IV sporulation protein
MEIRQDGFIYTEIYYEVEEIQWSKNTAKLKTKLEEMALAKVRKSMPPGSKIIDKKLKYDMIDNVKASTVISIEALEDIAVQQIIDTL